MYYIGIDVGGTNIKAGLIDENGSISKRAQAPTEANRPDAEIGATIARLAKEVAEGADGEIAACGIGIPGICDDKNGVVLAAANLNFENFPLRAVVENALSLPVYIGNDANCAALGEYARLPESVDNMIMVTLGTGIGGGLVLGGRLYTGTNGLAGEVGHILLHRGGEKCGCGRLGCWEAYASTSALIRRTKAYALANPESTVRKACGEDFSALSGRTAFDLYKEGDAGGSAIVEAWMDNVAAGLADLVHIFQPALILIGGAISGEGEALLTPIRRKVEKELYSSLLPKPEIRAAALGNDAGLIGAAFLGK